MLDAAQSRVVLKEDRVFAVSAPDGNMHAASPAGHGLWIDDTRVLSDFVLTVDGKEPVAGAVHPEAGSVCLESSAAGLHVERRRYVDKAGLHERIAFFNRRRSVITAEVELACGADFVDMMALRGFAPLAPRPGRLDVSLRPPGTRHRIVLKPRERFDLFVHVPLGGDFEAGLAGLRQSYSRWAADCASFETDNPALNELLERSRDDLRMLCDFYPTGVFPTGGIPWYAVPFGRDALVTALFTLHLNPDIARGTLRFLAAHQGRRVETANEEEPGKILHEVRTGRAVAEGFWPEVFYGTVDATPLYLCTLAETFDWTGDQPLFDELLESAELALEWCDRFGDIDGDGYLEYGSGRGRNQGWKDSDDSLTNVDGSDPVRPAALCEVQAYLYRALVTMAGAHPHLRMRAAELKRRFNRDFWIPHEGFVAQALDGRKSPIEAITSNPGHCLWAGVLTTAHARAVAARLLSPGMFSGWGVRTLSSDAINYDPQNGANGAVWAHDSAIAAEGMQRAGMAEQAELVARAVLEAGLAFPQRRIPEFWCGTARGAGAAPDEQPRSCSPQSWSAASPFSLLATILGLRADARRGTLHIAPSRTSLWSRLDVGGLHFAGHRVDLSVHGDTVKVGALPCGVKVVTS